MSKKKHNQLLSTLLISLGITVFFSVRYIYVLPFSGFNQVFNTETVATVFSFLIYFNEPINFPLGKIGGLTFPYFDANVGNVGAIPLFAIPLKILSRVIPYLKTFDYLVLINLVSCFVTAFFAQKILLASGVKHRGVLILGAAITASSYGMFIRAANLQAFCILSFPLLMAWIYAMLLTLNRRGWSGIQITATLIIFPTCALADNYTLFALLLGTSVLIAVELIEAYFSGDKYSKYRVILLFSYAFFGLLLSILVLYVIGMYPLPSASFNFTSYDFGMGGRLHVADLFSLVLIPEGLATNNTLSTAFILKGINFPFTTAVLSEGQQEGVAYVGTAAMLLIVFLILNKILSFIRNKSLMLRLKSNQYQYATKSPWAKLIFSGAVVYAFSLGYELHILGNALPSFVLMPAALLADLFPSTYNIRAPGRLAILLTLLICLHLVKSFSDWYERREWQAQKTDKVMVSSVSVTTNILVLFFLSIHLLDILPFMRPVTPQRVATLGGVYTMQEVETLRQLSNQYKAVLIAPNWRAGLVWQTQSYALSYYLGIHSNLYLIARTSAKHDMRIARDMHLLESGEWRTLIEEYGDDILFAIRHEDAIRLGAKIRTDFTELKVGPVSLWSFKKIPNKN
jgi:hypothetical protein